jgi:AbrB family looped-hinge helix DNA binding protein
MPQAKLSSKNQIVIPREARTALGVRPGDEILVVVRNSSVILLPKPKDHARAIRGMAKGLYPPGYLEREKKGWQ